MIYTSRLWPRDDGDCDLPRHPSLTMDGDKQWRDAMRAAQAAFDRREARAKRYADANMAAPWWHADEERRQELRERDEWVLRHGKPDNPGPQARAWFAAWDEWTASGRQGDAPAWDDFAEEKTK